MVNFSPSVYPLCALWREREPLAWWRQVNPYERLRAARHGACPGAVKIAAIERELSAPAGWDFMFSLGYVDRLVVALAGAGLVACVNLVALL